MQCHVHIVLMQLYVEPGNDFNVLFFRSVIIFFRVVLKVS